MASRKVVYSNGVFGALVVAWAMTGASCANPPAVGDCAGACGPGEVCAGGACRPVCFGDADCSGDEACEDSACVPLVNPDCQSAIDCTTPGSCQIVAGARCIAGTCRYEARTCPGGMACVDDACPPCLGNDPCDDGNPCTTGEHCVAGECGNGTPIPSNYPCEGRAGYCGPTGCLECQLDSHCRDLDGDPCTEPSCAAGGFCTEVPGNEGDDCDDGNLCSLGDHCEGGECVATPKDCSVPPDQCRDPGTCEPSTGECAYPIRAGQTCDDDDWCTSGDYCNAAGACVGVGKNRWIQVGSINYVQADPDGSWGAVQAASWPVAGNIYGVRVSGSSNDGGYCHAYWGTGHVAKYRHDGSVGWYNVDGKLYLPPFTGYCQVRPPKFGNDGTVQICQGNSDAGPLVYGTGEVTGIQITRPATIELRAQHFIGDGSDGVSCSLEVLCR